MRESARSREHTRRTHRRGRPRAVEYGPLLYEIAFRLGAEARTITQLRRRLTDFVENDAAWNTLTGIEASARAQNELKRNLEKQLDKKT